MHEGLGLSRFHEQQVLSEKEERGGHWVSGEGGTKAVEERRTRAEEGRK